LSDTSNSISKLDANQVLRLSYDQENNRLRVAATVVASIGEIDVHIDSASGDNISIASADGHNQLTVNPDGSINTNITNITLNQATDSIAIGDGVNLIKINLDGSINAVIQSSGLTTKNIFNEINNVPSGVTSTIVSLIALANTKLLSVDVGGTNIASYSVYIGTGLQAKKYTFYQTLNERFDFKDGLPVVGGTQIRVEVTHNRPSLGDFNASMLVQN
jgi:hypothetical protein